MNRWPGCQVQSSDSSINVYDKKGEHVVAMVKNGAGSWVDKSEELGLKGRFDLSPIPKDARVHKVKNGKISRDERADEREKMREEFLDKNGRVMSCEELSHEDIGYSFSKEQEVKRRPDGKAVAKKPSQQKEV